MSNVVKIYDTTLRDGTQGEGISFSVTDKLLIAERLDQFGVDYIEGGFPGSNPRDITFFQEARKLKLRHARLAAFGSTRRAGVKAAEDLQLRTLLDSGMPVMTIVGKTWNLHVTEILRTTLEENLAMIEDSARHLVAEGREVIYDAEHFFDGFKSDADYALRTLAAAVRGGASNLTLCDTNGGTLVDEFKEIVARVVKEFGADKVGVHCHNDSGLGVALSLAGVAAGATLVQGTVNGYGERVGNANMTTILPNIVLKMGRTARCAGHLAQLRDLSLFFDELANLRPDPKAPFVGQSAFAHKGGLHANAAQKVARKYGRRVASSARRIRPPSIGNAGRRLKQPITRFAMKTCSIKPSRECCATLSPPPPSGRNHKTPTMTKFTAGPAMVMRNSRMGWRGMSSNSAIPPMGIRRMRRTPMPKCIAVKECPSSWSTTQAKKATSVATLQSSPDQPASLQPSWATKASRSRKEKCTSRRIPRMRKRFIDHPSMQPNKGPPAKFASAFVRDLWPSLDYFFYVRSRRQTTHDPRDR
mgnify:CR=1 FL=1